MTWSEQIFEETGYRTKTTFWDDFSIADKFGEEGVRDTYKRAFKAWRNNYIYLTELVLVLNHKIWYWYKRDDKLGRVYDELWKEADQWAMDNLTGKEAEYYYQTLD